MSVQSMQALARANEIRLAKSAIKARIGSFGRHDAANLAADIVGTANPDTAAGAMSVAELVKAVPRHGEWAATRACRHAGIVSPQKKLRDLTPRQRGELALAIRSEILLSKRAAVSAGMPR